MSAYIVEQVKLYPKFMDVNSENLHELQKLLNAAYSQGYRLHTMTTVHNDNKGKDVVATLVFEKNGLFK